MVSDHECMLCSLLSRQRDAVRDLEHADIHPALSETPFSRRNVVDEWGSSGKMHMGRPSKGHNLGCSSMQTAPQPCLGSFEQIIMQQRDWNSTLRPSR